MATRKKKAPKVPQILILDRDFDPVPAGHLSEGPVVESGNVRVQFANGDALDLYIGERDVDGLRIVRVGNRSNRTMVLASDGDDGSRVHVVKDSAL